jgi:hypothetical protein
MDRLSRGAQEFRSIGSVHHRRVIIGKTGFGDDNSCPSTLQQRTLKDGEPGGLFDGNLKSSTGNELQVKQNKERLLSGCSPTHRKARDGWGTRQTI